MARADRAHRAAQRALDDRTGAKLGDLLRALEDPMTQAAFDAYNVASAAVVGGAQRRAAQLAIAYVATQVPTRPKRPPSAARALAGVVVSRTSPVTRSPILRVWGKVGEGLAVAAAIENAAAYAATLASNDLQVAQRGGLDEGASASGAKIIGWRKELSDDACDWCQTVGEDSVYSSPDGVPFHANDECSVAPVFEGEE